MLEAILNFYDCQSQKNKLYFLVPYLKTRCTFSIIHSLSKIIHFFFSHIFKKNNFYYNCIKRFIFKNKFFPYFLALFRYPKRASFIFDQKFAKKCPCRELKKKHHIFPPTSYRDGRKFQKKVKTFLRFSILDIFFVHF